MSAELIEAEKTCQEYQQLQKKYSDLETDITFLRWISVILGNIYT